MANRTVAVTLVADVGRYQSSMVQAATATRAVGTEAVSAGNQARRGFEAAGRGATLLAAAVGGALVVGLKSAVDAAAKAEQSIGGAEAVFKGYSRSVIASSEQADVALGLSANSYRELATVIGSQMKNAGVPLQDLAGQTEDIIGVGADLAAQFGGSTQQAVEALSSAFRGELDPIERYGISLTAAAVGAKAVELGLADSATNLSQNAKAMATLALITEQSADAQGAFARETDTASQRAQVAAAQWENLKVKLGDQLLPVWSSLVSVVSENVIPALGAVIEMGAGIVQFFGELPAPVQATVLALGGLALLNGPLSGVLTTIRGFGGNLFGSVAGTTQAFGQALGYARANGDGLGTVLKSVGGYAGGQLKSGLGGLVGMLGGPWGIAMAGAAAGVAYVTSTMADAEEQTHTWAQTILDGSAAMDDLTDAYLDQYNGEKPDWLQQQSELLGFTSSLEDAEAEARDLYDAMDPLAQAQQNVTYDTNRLVQAIAEFGEGSPEARQAADLLAASNERLATRQGQVADATDAATARMDEGVVSTADYGDAISEAKKEVDGLISSLAILTGANNSMLAAENAVGAAVAAATDALDEQGGTVLDVNGNLNSYSENGRAASDVLLDMANSSNELIATMIQQGDSVEAVTARDAELRASFIQTANTMGIVGADAERLADQIYGIPADRSTRITADTSQAEQAVQAFVARVTGTRVTLTGDFVGGAGVNVRRAAGGPVWGAGTGTSDSIPAMLSNGEYVVRAAAVSKYGVAALDAINQGRPSDLAFFAGGGLVDNYSVPVALSGLERIQVAIDAATSGPAGGGALGAGWASIWNIVKAAIPQARINSTVRPGDPGYHGRGKAIDIGFGSGPGGAGSAGLASIARYLYNGFGSTLAELIYDGIGDDTPDVKNGRPHTYNAATRAQHANHVHAAVYDQGGMLPSGMAALNLSGSPEMVLNPAQTAAAMRSREFSGSSSRSGSSQAVVVNIEGAQISGTLQMGGDGLMRIVDGRIMQAVTTINRTTSGRVGV